MSTIQRRKARRAGQIGGELADRIRHQIDQQSLRQDERARRPSGRGRGTARGARRDSTDPPRCVRARRQVSRPRARPGLVVQNFGQVHFDPRSEGGSGSRYGRASRPAARLTTRSTPASTSLHQQAIEGVRARDRRPLHVLVVQRFGDALAAFAGQRAGERIFEGGVAARRLTGAIDGDPASGVGDVPDETQVGWARWVGCVG